MDTEEEEWLRITLFRFFRQAEEEVVLQGPISAGILEG